MSSQPDSPASPSQSPESNRESKTKGICGRQLGMPYALFDQDTLCWKMSQDSLITDISGQSMGTLPQQGMTCGGRLYPLKMWEPPTLENDGGVWLTPIVINIDGASLSRYAPTGSMKPVLDEGSNGIRIKPASESDIHIGDIITFEQDNMLIVHRVVDIGSDNNGTYFITQGDNTNISDGKIRFNQIKYITIGVIW